MYVIYALAAIGVLAGIFVVRKLLKPSSQRTLSPFQQSRPKPDLSASDNRDDLFASREVPVHRVGETHVQKSLISNDPYGDRLPEQKTVSASSLVSARTSPEQNEISSTSVMPVTSERGFNRISTWNDRRLFSNFKGILSEGVDSIPLPAPEDLPIREDAFVFGSLTPSIAQLLPETDARRELQRKSLLAAGYHSRASWLNLSAIRFALSFLSLVVIGIWLIMAPPAIEAWLLGLLVMAPLFMWALPPLIVAFKASERKIDIERGLPDVLDMMNMGVSQGLTVPQSLKRISREIAIAHPALAEELRIVDQQAEVGNLPQALRNFGNRIDSPEISSFTSLLVQSESTGTSISKALTEYSDSIRASLKERADARANAASFQLLFPVALFLMPSVFLFLLGPAIVQMSDFFNSQADTLQQDRQDALRSLNQQPQLDLRRFGAPGGAFSPAQ
jgi:tight adherence protein C